MGDNQNSLASLMAQWKRVLGQQLGRQALDFLNAGGYAEEQKEEEAELESEKDYEAT
jgi:hypothetical protein